MREPKYKVLQSKNNPPQQIKIHSPNQLVLINFGQKLDS